MDALSALCIQEEAELLLEMQDIRDLFGVNNLTLQAATQDSCLFLFPPFLLLFVLLVLLSLRFLLFYPIFCPPLVTESLDSRTALLTGINFFT